MNTGLTHLSVRLCAWALLYVVVAFQPTEGQVFPEWSQKDRESLAQGELIAGASLLSDGAAQSERMLEVLSLLIAEPELLKNREEIPDEFLRPYFAHAPDTYLIDPQELLGKDEALSREDHLRYHAERSQIDIKLYLFDRQQAIPRGYSLQELVHEHYQESELTAVAFCFLGEPSRSLLAFGGRRASEVKPLEAQKILDVALLKAMEKTVPESQLEAFVVELSIKLYWIEKVVPGLGLEVEGLVQSEELAQVSETQEGEGRLPRPSDRSPAAVIAVISAILCLLVLAGAFVIWKKSRRYYFPVLDMPKRLGADYAAGVGEVITFYNKDESPSVQRDQVADYLAGR